MTVRCLQVLEVLGSCKRADEAYAFFQRTKDDGVDPDVKAYTQMLSIAASAGRCVSVYQFTKLGITEMHTYTDAQPHRQRREVCSACTNLKGLGVASA
jgi:hypothetical protein